MRPLDGLRDVFIKALREIPDNYSIGHIGVKRMLIDSWNKEIDYLRRHYDFTYISTNKEVSEGEE